MKLELQDMTMGELTEEAHRAGIAFVAHMSVQELIEAIEQQQETNALLPARERGDLTAG
ncbi:Rho termination factor, N-terminal domain [Prauserella marina]|uniref:Rho termination factor, N-terminal domain n=1 Tax=Prauserella marina TaxID=530584 RepID=A0A1G6I276_9PSEU|nr:Rho termination factor N-terminal domain-containing protein [Prauserella marina]PWV85289.1 Rho termination factor-like protein [Prauserella marina]SDC00483.1 Rho termination factor, N-terminal domain [Prauserella marina]